LDPLANARERCDVKASSCHTSLSSPRRSFATGYAAVRRDKLELRYSRGTTVCDMGSTE
jgi:hypothetical protein